MEATFGSLLAGIQEFSFRKGCLMINVILWDIDGTILDFSAAERNALRECFSMFRLGECTDAMIANYSAINATYWKRLERGEIDKHQALTGRFAEFFHREGVCCGEVEAFNQEYQLQLANTICFIDNAYSLIQELQTSVKQYAVTNGTLTAQERKLKKSGLNDLLDGVFISDRIGAEKPSKEFFDYVFRHIGNYKKEEILIVGDSLTSDMKGGNLAGIRCCWYNPQQKENTIGVRVDYMIHDLNQVKELIHSS